MIKCPICGFESTIDEINGTKGIIDYEICYSYWLIEPKDSPKEKIIEAIE